jgi:hypothetical protein
MFDKIDLNNLNKKAYHIGNLEQKVIDLLQLQITPGIILIDVSNIKHIEKHKAKFKSEAEYVQHIQSITEIILNPDFVGVHPDGISIEFFKKIDEILVLAIRIRPHEPFWVRTVFPITPDKLQTYIDAGTLKKY